MEYTKSETIKRVIRDNQDLFISLEELDRTGKLRKASYKKRYNFTLDQDMMQRFRTYCTKNDLIMSGKIEKLIRDFLLKQK